MGKNDDDSTHTDKQKLMETLWLEGSEESCKELVEIAQRETEAGNVNASVFLAWAYRDGKGIAKNLQKSIDLLFDAYGHDPKWSITLMETLWLEGSEESCKELIDVVQRDMERGHITSKHVFILDEVREHFKKELMRCGKINVELFVLTEIWIRNVLSGRPVFNELSVNIIGCCVSRNIFNLASEPFIKPAGYIFRQNPLLILQKDSFYLNDSDIDACLANPSLNNLFKMELKHNFNRRTLENIFNGTISEYLQKRKGKWILLDTNYIQYSRMLSVTSSGSLLIQNDVIHHYNNFVEKCPKLINCKHELFTGCININNYIEQLCVYLKENWGDNIILIHSRPIEYYITPQCTIKPIKIPDAEVSPGEYFCKSAEKYIKIHHIDIPGPTIGIDSNTVHYIEPTMRYIRKMVNLIITNQISNSFEIATINEDYVTTINNLFNDDACLVKILIDSLDVYGPNVDILARIGIAYKYGLGIARNEILGCEFLRQASKIDESKTRLILSQAYSETSINTK